MSQECNAEKKLSRVQNLQIERELDHLSYTCGGCFQDMSEIEDSVFSLFFVNDKLSCAAPIEVPCYAPFTHPLCFFYDSEDIVDCFFKSFSTTVTMVCDCS